MKTTLERLFQSVGLNTLLALTLLPGILAMAYTYYSSYQLARDAARQDLLGRVRSMSQLVDQSLLGVQRNLQLLAAISDELGRADYATFHEKLRDANAAMPLADVLLLNTPDGRILLSSKEPLGTRLPTSNRAASISRTDRPTIGPIIRGTSTERLLIPIDVPIRINGKVAYVLTAGIYCEHINQLLSQHIFPDGWIAVIYDSNGTIAGRQLDSERFIGQTVAPTLQDWLAGPPERIGEGRTLEGRLSFAAMHRSTMTGYSVTASVPTTVLDTPLRNRLVVNLLIGGAGLSIGILLAWRFAQGLRSSIRELEAATDAVAAGQTTTVVPAGSVELVRLTRRFNSMQEALNDSRETQARYQRELEHAATHDPLTGLANRTLLNEQIHRAIAVAIRSGGLSAILLLDLDRFKVVNDTLSHSVGDALLVETAKRMRQVVRDTDTVGRFGGDEFLVVLTDVACENDIAMVAHKLMTVIVEPVFLAGHQLSVSASIGIAMASRDGLTASELLMNADIAMYRAKESGRNRFQFFELEMNTRMQERLELEAGLRQALKDGHFVLYYQPRCDARTGHIVGAEALIRWRHPTRGLVSPAHFIPVAEETGLIVPIGEWVLNTACGDAQRWAGLRPEPLTVSVNVSARQFQSGNLARTVAQCIEVSGLHPAQLELELTETDVMNDAEHTLKVLGELKRVGVRVSLDDFGTGYSSLGYLKRFPIDCLKIDQSFVRDIAVDPEDAAIARMVVTLGHSLRLKVVAEGVETHEQLQFLQSHQCDQIQGYIFSPPVPAQEFETMLLGNRRLT